MHACMHAHWKALSAKSGHSFFAGEQTVKYFSPFYHQGVWAETQYLEDMHKVC